MKVAVAVVILLICLGQSQVGQPITVVRTTERPIVNLPVALRQTNWSSGGQGCCVWATTVSLLNWQGRERTAERLRRVADGGAEPEGFAQRLDSLGIRYAYVTNGDVKFLEWALRTRRGCGVTVMGGAHFVALVHLDSKSHFTRQQQRGEIQGRRAAFLAEWTSYGWFGRSLRTRSPRLRLTMRTVCSLSSAAKLPLDNFYRGSTTRCVRLVRNARRSHTRCNLD